MAISKWRLVGLVTIIQKDPKQSKRPFLINYELKKAQQEFSIIPELPVGAHKTDPTWTNAHEYQACCVVLLASLLYGKLPVSPSAQRVIRVSKTFP